MNAYGLVEVSTYQAEQVNMKFKVKQTYRRPLDVNIDEVSVTSEDLSHLLLRDVDLQVAGEQGPGGKRVILWRDVGQVVRELVPLGSVVPRSTVVTT